MKKNYFLTIFLISSAILSIILSYFLIYDYAAFRDFINKGETNTSQESTIKQNDLRTPSFYKSTNLTMKDVFKPNKVIYRNDESTQWITDPKVEDQLLHLFSTEPIQLRESDPSQDSAFIDTLYSTNHLQFIYTDKLPLNVLEPLVELPSNNMSAENIHRMIIPLDGTGAIYLINSEADKYYSAKLPKQVKEENILSILNAPSTMRFNVQGYISNVGLVYLPNAPVKTKSQLYTVENIPESVMVKDFFENNEFKNSESDENQVTYFNYLYTLDFHRDKHLLDVRVSRPDEGESRNQIQKIENSFKSYSRFEYWRQQARMMNPNGSTAVYRRYVNGLPIFPSPGNVDHGAMIFQLRSNKSAEIFRFQVPLQIIQAHISDMSKSVQLPSADEIQDMLKENGVSLQNFDDVIIGYEIQEDTESYKKMELIPKWYFKMNNTYYSWNQIATKEFQEKLNELTNDPEREV